MTTDIQLRYPGLVDYEETLVEIEFLRQQQSPQLMPKLRQIYNRIRLKSDEMNILRGILTKTQRYKKTL